MIICDIKKEEIVDIKTKIFGIHKIFDIKQIHVICDRKVLIIASPFMR